VGESKTDTDGGTSAPDGMSPQETGPQLSAGTANVNGMVDGLSLAAKDAIGEASSRDTTGSELWVAISDRANTCALVQQGAEAIANAMGLRLHLSSSSSSPATIGKGTYAIGDADTTKAHFTSFFSTTDATCSSGGRVNATAGTLTIEEVTSSVISGTFDLTFPSGSMNGSFSASRCSTENLTGHVRCGQ
jgi:hypothetical protein